MWVASESSSASGVAVEALAGDGIRVNCVSPGPIFIEGGAWDFIKNNMAEVYEGTLAQIPRGSMGSAEEVANAVTFLAGPAAAYVTGETLYIDGGMKLWGTLFPLE